MEQKFKNRPAFIEGAVDVLALIIFGVLFGAALGFAIYVFAVWVLIPVATAVSPAINRALTNIGEKYDTEAIYSAIKSFCGAVGMFPGLCAANVSLKNREKRFIHDTGGTIVPREALKYHISLYLAYDIAAAAGIVAVCLLIRLLGGGSLSPLGFFFDRFGVPLGLIFSAAAAALAQLCGVLFAQGCWRADYFYGG